MENADVLRLLYVFRLRQEDLGLQTGAADRSAGGRRRLLAPQPAATTDAGVTGRGARPSGLPDLQGHGRVVDGE
ncbi:hypothetical protein GCM10018966_078230 [Streptomyces yanii]